MFRLFIIILSIYLIPVLFKALFYDVCIKIMERKKAISNKRKASN